jgi:hypothetical protein
LPVCCGSCHYQSSTTGKAVLSAPRDPAGAGLRAGLLAIRLVVGLGPFAVVGDGDGPWVVVFDPVHGLVVDEELASVTTP